MHFPMCSASVRVPSIRPLFAYAATWPTSISCTPTLNSAVSLRTAVKAEDIRHQALGLAQRLGGSVDLS
jgi:hypothetical protein